MPTGIYKRTDKHLKQLVKQAKRARSFITEKSREKMRKAHKGMKKPWASLALKGKPGRAKGKKWLWSIKSRKNRKGELNPNYKGTTPRSHHIQDRRYKEWRIKVFKRDNFTCCMCHRVGGYLEAHHIKSWAKYPKLRYKVSNGLTLCRDCHQSINQTH